MYQVPVRDEESWLRARLRRHVFELLRLSGPVIVARAGLLVMAIVDAIMVGRYGTIDLAYVSLASAPVGAIIATGVGLMIGTMVMTAHALGRGTPDRCGAVWQRGTIYATAIGTAGLGICLFGEPILLLLGQTPDLATGAGRLMVVLGYGLPAAMVYSATAFFMEGLKRPVPGMVAMMAANLLNVLVNWLLVFGNWGLPELGAEGAAWASTIVRLFLACSMIIYVWRLPDHERYGIRRWHGWRWRDWSQQRRIGYGGGASIGVESAAFALLGIFAGWLGAVALAAYAIAFNLLALIFMVALGLGSATAVRVGIAHGRNDGADLTLAGWTGLGVNTLVMLLLGVVLWHVPDAIAGAFTGDSDLIARAAPVIAFCGLILVFDGGQVVMANALRGRGDALVPTVFHTVSYMVVMMPAGWLLAFPLDHGVMGLYEGILIASIVSVSLLAWRFQRLARYDRRRRESTAIRSRVGAVP